jgi:hypothetical protein
MTRYFFDFFNGGAESRDSEGTEFDSDDAARDEAVMALVEMAREVLPGSSSRELAFEVRDEDGRRTVRVSIVFDLQLA